MADRVNAVGNKVRASGRWNGTYQEWGGGTSVLGARVVTVPCGHQAPDATLAAVRGALD